MKTREKLSFCRTCMGHCGVVVTVDENDRMVGIRADRDDEQTLGFACFKGLQAVDAHTGPARLLHPLKRQADGSFARIPLEQALDEIASGIRMILDRDGPAAVGGYRGGGAFFNASASTQLQDFLAAIGSEKLFSSVTIDQSAKIVAIGRLGFWPPGIDPFHLSDVTMAIGGNPLVSVTNLDLRNPVKRLKEAKARGLKLIVIDPRLTETARFADIFLQPLPGEDCTILAGMLRIILERGWEDTEFCREHVADLAALRDAVAPFTPDYVARRADIPADKLFEATEAFAGPSKGGRKRGSAFSATGPNMSPHSNLAEHLIGCLNIVCGRFVREGERISNPGVLAPRYPRPAQVVPPARPWDHGSKSRVGDYGILGGEMVTGILADEILQPGPGQIRALIVHGGNPASAVPDQRKIVKALRSLELLVSIEPYMTPTAKLSHYILPPTMQYERPDLPLFLYESLLYPIPFTRYTEAVSQPPEGAEVRDEVALFWSLSRRLGLTQTIGGVPVDMACAPTPEDALKIAARHAPVPWEAIKDQPRGAIFEGEPQFALPADPATAGKFELAAPDILAEIAEVAHEADTGADPVFTHRLASRRHRDRFNSMGNLLSGIRQRVPYNVVYLNPGDMAAATLARGDWIELSSDSGAVRAIAEPDETLRSGVVSLIHGFGELPEDDDYRAHGVSTNLLISTDRDLQTINAMPRMSAIPVNIRRVEAGLRN